MSALDTMLERLVPVVEWAVFRSRQIATGIVVVLLSSLIFSWGWPWLTAVGRSPVRGRVTAAGRPITFGTVTVMTADGSVLTAAIRPDGSYELPHVPPGPIRLAVASPEPRSIFQKALDSPIDSPLPSMAPGTKAPRVTRAKQAKQAEEPGAEAIALRVDVPPPSTQSATLPAHAGWFRLPGRYADPVRSGLQATVEPRGSTLNLDLDAESGGSR